MNSHASINRIFRLIWNEALSSWVPVSEITRGRGKRSGRAATALVAALGLSVTAHAGAPTAHATSVAAPAAASTSATPTTAPAPTQLPTGGTVVGGSATITSSSTPSTAVLDVDQTSQRAVIDWNTFNLGSAAQVNFVEPNSNAATLNRVLDSNASQIFGKITGNGQIFISNPNGVYFSKSATVDVGSLTATTNGIDNADFMAGKITLTRDGATGSVVNDGNLQAAVGGYIALLAPEVRNGGIVVARLGTVAMAAGESITLNLNGNHLAGITVQPSAIAALVENKGAVLAPGGLIILSAKAVDSLLGGVVNNSGSVEATGLSTQGGRIVLQASSSVQNSGTINANAGADGSPAGSVTVTAPAIVNSGSITAAATVPSVPAPVLPPVAGGQITLTANTIVQTATGTLDVSGASGGSITLAATQDITVAGSVSAAATDSAATGTAVAAESVGYGGSISFTSGRNITLQSALVDASGTAVGGEIVIQGGGQSPSAPPADPPTLALLGNTELLTSSRRGKGGNVTLTGDNVNLLDTTSIDASGALGGGDVFIGGGFHGQDPSIANAQQTDVSSAVTIDASATQTGEGGQVVLWSDSQTTFAGSIAARGGAASGSGGTLEVSSKNLLNFTGTVNAGAPHGTGGSLLLDPQNITVDSSGTDSLANETFATNEGTTSLIAPAAITAVTNTGTAVTLQANTDITINSSIVTSAPGGTGGALAFQAGRSITVNASVISDNGNITFSANDPNAISSDRSAGAATFTNNSLIDAGTGTVSITMNTFTGTGATSGTIETGHVSATNFTVVQDGPTAGVGTIDLGETDLTGNLSITANSATNVTNILGSSGQAGEVIVRGTATISVGAGNVTINGPDTDFSIIGLTAGNVLLNNAGAVQFAATNVSGSLTETTVGPISSTGSVQVAGAASFTANSGGFGIADPYINLSNSANHFAGGLVLDVPSLGATGTGGYATIRDSGALTVDQSTTQSSLAITAGGAVTLGATGPTGAGTSISVSTSTGNITTTGATTAGSTVTYTTSSGAVTTGSTTAPDLYVTATGAVSLGASSISQDLTVSTSAPIFDTGVTSVGRQTTLTAGSANNITFGSTTAPDSFNYMRIVSGDNVTLTTANGIDFGNWNSAGGWTSTISGNLSITSGANIQQVGQGNTGGYSAISVGGATTFTANGSSQIQLLLGSTNPFNSSGQANLFSGGVTLASESGNNNTGFSVVEIRDTNPAGVILTGLTAVGTLTNVYLEYNNATSITLPGMTVTGVLDVFGPSVANTGTTSTNIISQTGPIVVGGATIMAAASTGDIVLNNASNDFYSFGVANTGARNLTLVNNGALIVYAPAYNQAITGNLSITANGEISDQNYSLSVAGTATLNAGSTNTIYLVQADTWTGAVSLTGDNVTINPQTNLILGNSSIAGTLSITARNANYSLTQSAGSAVIMSNTSATTSFNSFSSGITLGQGGNVFGPLAISGITNSGASITIEENSAITQASSWNNYNGTTLTNAPVALTTSNGQAITLTQGSNRFGNLTLTQLNTTPSTAGAVAVTETSDSTGGMTQSSSTPWTVYGTTTLNSGSNSINLINPNNILGPLQVTNTTGTTGSPAVPSTVTIFAKNTSTTDAISDVGSTGAWSTGTNIVKLVAYDTTGATAGGGNITLTNPANLLGALYLKGNNVTITENASITDGPSLTNWDGGNDSGWVTTGTTTLVVANPTLSKTINLSNLTDLIGPIALSTTGTGTTLGSVLITDNENITQAGAWIVGTAPVTLNSHTDQIDLTNSANVMGNINITTTSGTPTAVNITENAPITQGSAWVLTGWPVTLVAENGNAITLTNASNIFGNLSVTQLNTTPSTAGAVSITENGTIMQAAGAAGAWTTVGTTTLNPTAGAITLTNAANVFGPLAIAGAPSAVSITANAPITQASAWVEAATPFTLNAGTNDILLSQANNQLGALTLTAQDVTVTENNTAGITQGGAWTIPGITTLNAGAANPIILTANPASSLGTVSIVSASNAAIDTVGPVNFGTSTISTGGTLAISASGTITQSGAITAPSLQLIGTGNALLADTSNNVNSLAAGFSGGDLTFANAGSFAIGVVNGTSGVTIGDHNVTLSSATGTVTGLSNINASSSSLTLTTGAALSVPQMSIAGPQTYTAGGAGITLTTNVTSTATGAINFDSPVTLAADLTVQSTNSPINFAGAVTGDNYQLNVNAGSGLVNFTGAVSGLGTTTDASAALTLASGGATFDSTVSANNGLAVTGPVTFTNTVSLADGSAASVFTGLVTLGNAGGMNISGYNNMSFDDGVLLQSGPATINSNNSPLTFQNADVTGPWALTLNSGTAALTGLNLMGSNLRSLTVTALSPIIPAGGISIAGPQTYTATSNSNITLNGNVASTLAGAITFLSPVTVGAASTVSSVNSNVVFASTVNGNSDLTVNAGSGTTTFSGAVGTVAPLGSGTGAALVLQGSGAATFDSTVQARSGMSAAGPVNFDNNVTLTAGDTGSAFSGLVTSGGTTGNSITGFGGIAFNGGLALTGGPVSVASNGSTLSFGGPVTGAENLTLNALAGAAGTVTGLNEIGDASNLTGLTVTAQTLSLPSTGLAVAGPMSFTAAGGITLNGAVGSASAPATGAITFNGPVTLAIGPVAVTTDNAAIDFVGTVNGAEALTVNAGTATTTFGAAVGGTTPLASLTANAGGGAVIDGGVVDTSGAQNYGAAVTLGANTTLTGDNVQFGGTLNGAYALTISDSGTTSFDGTVGGSASLANLTTNSTDGVAMNAAAVTTTGAQTYDGAMALGANATFGGIGITFASTVDGPYAVTANAGSGALRFNGVVGGATALASLGATGYTISAANVRTSGTQTYTALSGLALNGNLTTDAANITVTGPTTLGADATLSTGTGTGNIVFYGSTSTIDGAHSLTLTAGGGDVTLGGVVGGVAPLSAINVSGYDLTLPDISTANGANQTYTALDNITLTQSRTLDAPISFTADSDNNGVGSFILLSGVSLTASNNTLTIRAADINLEGNSTLASGTGLMTLIATDSGNIILGGTTDSAPMTITGSELSRMSSSGGLDLETTGAGSITVNGITAAQSQNITGTLSLLAQSSGNVSFVTAPSTFNALTVNATAGTTNVGVNLTTNDGAITFVTPVAISGASTVNSGGGNITFDGPVSVNNNLTLTTGNGVLTFGGAVGSNQTLTLNLGGGSVSGLGELQSTLTGLTVNGTSGITLPAFGIDGPQVYNTGVITVTGNLGGVGLAFNNVVDVMPAAGTALTLTAGTGTLAFGNLVSFNANNMTLTADQINFTHAVTGSGSLRLQPFTSSLDVEVGSSGAPITGLNLTAADLSWLPIGTLTSLTIGSPSGSGTLDLGGTLNAPGTPLTLNGGGGISQSGGSVTSGALTLYAGGNTIALANGANAVGAVGINGTPSAFSLTNTLDIGQLGSAAWNLGAAPITLNAGTHNITLNNTGNTFGTMVLNGGNVQVTEAASTDIGASTIGQNLTVASSGAINVSGALDVTGNVSLTSTGEVTQSAPLTVGGNLNVATTVNAGDVTLNNSGATATAIGNTQVGGNYTLTATNEPISQGAGASLLVAGNLTLTGSTVLLSGAGNLIGGSTTLSATSSVTTNVVDESGVITLGNRTETGNLTVISEATNRTFSGAPVTGTAVLLNNASNNIAGSISVSASPPTVGTSGADVQTGINQTAGTTISVAGVASFTAEASTAGSLGINLTNAGNSFGTLLLSGNTVAVANSATGLTTIGGALATTSLTLSAAGGVAQSGAIQTPALAITATGPVTLTNVANNVGSLAATSGGNAVSFVNSTDLSIAGINAGGANVSLTAGGTGNLTQTAALADVGTLSANAGGAVALTNTGNSIATLAASVAGSGMQVYDATAVAVVGAVATTTGDLTLRAVGNLTLDSVGSLAANAGNVVASTEGAGNFINDSAAAGAALVVGSGDRWLVYSDTPDLVAGAHTVKGGLTSSFRDYAATYTTYSPGAVTESGNGFIYDYATPTLTVAAAIVNGAPSQVYGSNPSAHLGYSITGFVDSEDNAANVIGGGTAAYSTSLSDTMNAGTYSITYTGGLTSNYTLTPATTGAAYTVTPAVLTYAASAASRTYGAANPTLGGTLGGYVLNQNVNTAGLTGSATWTTVAAAGSGVGQYGIDGAGYTSTNGNYTFAQATANGTALTINPATLTVTANPDAITYNGTGFGGGAGVTYSGFVNNETASVLGGTLTYGGTAQGARNANTYTLTVTGLTDANYAINYVGSSLVIDKANLTLTTGNVTKTYNGALNAAGTAEATTGTQLYGSDTVSGGTYAYTNANAGSGDKTVTVGGVTVNDGDGGNNYSVSYTNNTTSTITPASLTVEAANVTKSYDGALTATSTPTVVSGTLYHNVSNGNAQDTVSGGSYAYTDPNAGVGNKSVTVGGVTVNDGNGGGNYNVTYVNNTTSTINPATLTFAGTVADKTYDGTTAATLSGYTLTGFIGNQTVDANAGSASFLDPNAGTAKNVAISGITLANGTNGGLASNYTVTPTATSTGTINPAVLTVNASVANKVYDGTTTATLGGYGLSGFVGNQTVTGVGGAAAFADKNVGNDKPVTITGITLVNGANGGLASNYVVSPNATSNADITPATLQVAGVVALNTVYNGTTVADVDTQAAVLTGVVAGDNVSVGSITGNYSTKNVGTNLPIVTTAFALSGTDASNYTLVQPTGLTASITPRPLTVTATGENKVYDGTTAASVVLADNTVAGDTLDITSTNNFLDPSAGTGKYIAVTNIAISGTNAQDYRVNSSTAAYANITPATLIVTATGVNKVYNGATAATVTLTDDLIAVGTLNLSYGSASFANKNVGNDKTVTVNGITVSGADASDYTVSSVATTTANITPATLTVNAVANSKTYNGTTAATVVLTDNAFAGDQVTLAQGSATFANATVGNDKVITVNGIAIAGGADAGDYVLGNTTAATTGDIVGASAPAVSAAAAATWSLPPAPPQAVTVSIATAAPAVMDLTLPLGFGAGTPIAAAATNVYDASSGSGTEVNTDSSDLITVSLDQPATAQFPGAVSVSVPEKIVASGKGFGFPLPAALAAAAAGGSVQVSLQDGGPLPSWLLYVPGSKTFVAAATMPARALPVQTVVRIGDQRWTLSIIERTSR